MVTSTMEVQMSQKTFSDKMFGEMLRQGADYRVIATESADGCYYVIATVDTVELKILCTTEELKDLGIEEV